MALKDCIAKVGKTLSDADRSFLEKKLEEGMSDDAAINALEHKVELDIQEIVDSVKVAGFDLQTDEVVTIIGTHYEKVATQIATGSESGQRTGPEAEVTGLTVTGEPPAEGWREHTTVTSRGQPLRVFRGSRTDLTPEKFTQLGMNTGSPQSGLGVFFAAKQSDAKVFGNNIQEVYLDIRKPYVMTLKAMQQFYKQGYFNSLDNAILLADMMKEHGHDGIILDMRAEEDNIHFIAFEPEQVIIIPRDLEGSPYTKLSQGTDALGFFSRIEQALETMKLPGWKKPDGTVKGKEIAAKLGSMGLKKVETDWTGTLDMFGMLLADSSLTRNEAIEHFQGRRIELIETEATEDADEYNYDDELDWDEEVDDDSSNWEHRIEDYRYEWEAGEDPYFFNEDEQIEYAENNLMEEAKNLYVQAQVLDEEEATALEETLDQMGIDELQEFLAEEGFEYTQELREAGDLDARFEELAEGAAEAEYYDNPYVTYSAELESDYTLLINGNGDIGYSIGARNPNGTWIDIRSGGEVWSLNEAQIQAIEWARENDLMRSSDGDDVARWGTSSYVHGSWDNYREIKVKLPPGSVSSNNQTDFHYTGHFPDANIVGFIRATDRQFFADLPVELSPEQMAAYEREMADLTPPNLINFDDPELNVAALNAMARHLPNWSADATTHAVEQWKTRDAPNRLNAWTTMYENVAKVISEKYFNRLSPEQQKDVDDPKVEKYRERLQELQEQWSSALDNDKGRLKDRVRAAIDVPDKTVLDANRDRLLEAFDYPKGGVAEIMTRIDALEDVASINGMALQIPGALRGNTEGFQTRAIKRETQELEKQIEWSNRTYNSYENKLSRAGKSPSTMFFMDEVQSDWATAGRNEGVYDPDGREPYEIDQERIALNSDMDQRIETAIRIYLTQSQVTRGTVLKEWGYDVGDDLDSTDPAFSHDRLVRSLREYTYEMARKSTEHWGSVHRWLNEVISSANELSEANDIDYQWIQDSIVKSDALDKEYKAQAYGVPPMPFMGDEWLNLMMKRAVIKAVEENYKTIGWPNNQLVQDRWSENYDYSMQYDNKMPSLIKKLLGKNVEIVEIQEDEDAPVTRVPPPRIKTDDWKIELYHDFEVVPGAEPVQAWRITIPALQMYDQIRDLVDLDIGGNDRAQADNSPDPQAALQKLVETKVFEKYKDMAAMAELYKPVRVEGGWGLSRIADREMVTPRNASGGFMVGKTPAAALAHAVQAYYAEHYPPPEAGYFAVKIPEQVAEQIKAQGLPILQKERGRFFPGEGDSVIQLTKTSDLSTFLHESSHLFLEVQKTWSRKYGMTKNQQAMLDFFGLSSFDQLTVEHQEKWAESFEVYLREGKPPSLALRDAFAAFSRWLKKIYRTLTDGRLRRADQSNEITEIFDRLLATEEQIAEMAAYPEYEAMFRSPEEAGMTEKEWAEYQRRKARVKDNAETAVDERVIAQYMKTKTAEWKAEQDELAIEERAKLEQLPVYRLIRALTGDKANNIPAVKFDTDALKAMYPDGIPKKLSFRQTKEGGMTPDEYAEAFGYASAQIMMDELIDTPSITDASQELAKARMLNKYGDILNDGTLESEVREALLNDDQARLLEMEIKATRKSPGINRTYLKARAKDTISKMKFADIKPSRYYRAMVRAAQDAVRAIDPAEAKIRQLTNHYLYREALATREQMEKHRKYVRSVSTRKFDTKKIDPEYAQRMKMLAEMYDMRKSPEQKAALSDILNFFAAQVGEVGGDDQVDLTMLDPNLIRAVEHRIHHGGSLVGFELTQFEDMTAEDLHGVVDMLRHIGFVGRQISEQNGLEAVQERMSFIEWIRAKGGRDFPLQRGKQVLAKGAREKWSYMINTIPSLVNLVRKLDGMVGGGMAFDLIYRTVSDANDRKLALNTRYYDRFETMAGNLSKIKLSRRDSQQFVLEDQKVLNLSSEERFMFALYWGTESSRQALRDGFTVTDADAQNIMSTLTVDQLNVVNAIWAMNETHWPELRAAAIDMEGYAPPKLEATPFVVNGVQMIGGHMQLFYDSQRIDLKNEQEIGTRKGSVMPTKAGSLNARVGSGGQPVKLDIHNITRSIDDKVHFVAFAQAGRKLRRLINHKDVVAAIERKHGAALYQSMVEEIEAITTNRAAQETHKTIAAISAWMRSSATMMNLMYSIRNTVQQFSALPIAAKEVGPARFVWASAKLLSERQQMVKFINGKSKFMENRAQVINRDSREAMKKMIATSRAGSMYEQIKGRGFILQTMIDSTVAYPTWLAAYDRGMETHGDEKRAQIDADTAVGESVGSGSDLHLGRIMQSNQSELIKTFTIFGSWFNAYYQRLYRSSKGGTDFINTNFAWDAIILPFIAANIAQALILDMPDEKDDQDWYAWAMTNYAKFMLGTVPIVRDIASFMEGFTPTGPVMAAPKALTRVVTEYDSYASGKQSGLKTTVDVGRAASSVLKVPGSGQAMRILEYIDSFQQGEENGLNLYQMMVEGADKDE